MTEEPIFQRLLRFSLPMIAGNLLQQVYNLVDALIVGKRLGADALASVGSAYTLMVFVDVLMGTLYFDSVKKVADEAGIKYMPFVGEITGRPSVLNGTIEGMIDEANNLVDTKGIKGFDLLGYRYTGDAVKLNAEFVQKVRGDVCLAGIVASFQRLDEVKATGAWAFTIGGAFFENKFGENLTFGEQIDVVVDYMNN